MSEPSAADPELAAWCKELHQVSRRPVGDYSLPPNPAQIEKIIAFLEQHTQELSARIDDAPAKENEKNHEQH